MTARLESLDGGKPERTPKERASKEHPASLRRPRCRSLAVTSGKGGVGKTNIAANLAIALARKDRRILLVDGDLSLANLDLLMGVMPRHNVEQVISGEMTIEEVIVPSYKNIRLVPAASGVEEIANLDDFRRECLLRSLSSVDQAIDLILIDTGSGIAKSVTGLALAAEDILIVTTPEPTAVSQAYAMIKVLASYPHAPVIKVLVNMAASPFEAAQVYNRICKVSGQFLRVLPENWGYVEDDPAVRRAVANQEPFLLAAPQSPASAAIERLAQRVIELDPEPRNELSTDHVNDWLDRLKQRAG